MEKDRASYILVVLLILCCSEATVASTQQITSVKSVSVTKNEIYVAAGYPYNQKSFQGILTELWDSLPKEPTFTDSYNQPWKTVDISRLEKHSKIDVKYKLLNLEKGARPNWKKCSAGGPCTPKIKNVRFENVSAKGAYLFKWGCDGDIIPVLHLGRWPWGFSPEYPDAVVIGLTDQPELEIKPFKQNMIPTSLTKDLSSDFTGVTIQLMKSKEQFFLTYHQYLTGESFIGIFASGRNDGLKLMKVADLMDTRC